MLTDGHLFTHHVLSWESCISSFGTAALLQRENVFPSCVPIILYGKDYLVILKRQKRETRIPNL